MCTAAVADVCSSSELALAMSRMQTAAGLAMLLTPFIEGRTAKFMEKKPWNASRIDETTMKKW